MKYATIIVALFSMYSLNAESSSSNITSKHYVASVVLEQKASTAPINGNKEKDDSLLYGLGYAILPERVGVPKTSGIDFRNYRRD